MDRRLIVLIALHTLQQTLQSILTHVQQLVIAFPSSSVVASSVVVQAATVAFVP